MPTLATLDSLAIQ